jgi:hypothetical protein
MSFLVAPEHVAYCPGQYDTHCAGNHSRAHHSSLSEFLNKIGVISSALLIPAAIFTVPVSGVYAVTSVQGANLSSTYHKVLAGDVLVASVQSHIIRVY